MMNTEKALSVIMGIFLSVAIAFIAGTLVQYISRIIFSFNYKNIFPGQLVYSEEFQSHHFHTSF